jgi:hypothetical protein
VEGSLNAVVDGALALYETAYPHRSQSKPRPELPGFASTGLNQAGHHQPQIDNAIAALGERSIDLATTFDPAKPNRDAHRGRQRPRGAAGKPRDHLRP